MSGSRWTPWNPWNPWIFTHTDMLSRSQHNICQLHQLFHPGFLGSVTISLLPEADVHHAAQISACGQDIAAKGSFAAAFVGNFHSWTHPRRSATELPPMGSVLRHSKVSKVLKRCFSMFQPQSHLRFSPFGSDQFEQGSNLVAVTWH